MSDAHLSRDELIVWRDEGAGDRGRIVTHLASCAACREIAADVVRNRPLDTTALSHVDVEPFIPHGYRAGGAANPPRLAKRWMWATAAAAVVVLAIVPVWIARSDREPDAMRSGATALMPLRPVDVTLAADELSFEWTGASATDRVRLNVVDLDRADAPLIEREVTGSRYEPTAEERSRFRSGQSVYWYVEARGASGGSSPAARFRVR